jgi:eukaryotic-like serine/threonine-protein kinase
MKKIILYFLPFLFFIIGYYSLSWLAYAHKVMMPSVIGISLSDAMLQFSDVQLNVRILGQEESEYAPGTIIRQIPAAGSLIKPNQRVFIVLAKQPEKLRAPRLLGLTCNEAKILAKKNGIQIKQHEIQSAIYPKESIIAQAPHEDVPLEQKVVHIYVCSGEETIMIFPDFIGQSVGNVQEFCVKNGMKLEVVYSNATDEQNGYDQYVIKNQRPLAGSLIDIKKSTQVQVSIEKL